MISKSYSPSRFELHSTEIFVPKLVHILRSISVRIIAGYDQAVKTLAFSHEFLEVDKGVKSLPVTLRRGDNVEFVEN